jgi:hypothetical protein
MISNSKLNATNYIPLIGGERKLSCPKTYDDGTVTASFAFYSVDADSGFILGVNKVREVETITLK